MKRAFVWAPFVLLVGLSVAAHWIENKVIGNAWFLSFLGCLLVVPIASRHKLWLGYAALLFPFVVLAAFVTLDWGSLKLGL